jgi:outer membrane receptor protein involved in Fe transport
MGLELFAGSSWNNEDQPVDPVPTARDHYNEHFEMGKFSMRLDEGSQLEILSSYKDAKDTFAPTTNPAGSLPAGNPGNTDHTRDYQYDEEIMHRLDWSDGRMNTTYGFNYEKTRVFSAYEFAGKSPVGYQVYRGFLNQTARLNDYLSFVGAFAWEGTDRGTPHPNYQFSAVLKPTSNHAFHLNYSVAHTIPTQRLLDVSEQLNPTKLRVGNPDIKPETLESYEAGYRGRWLDRHLEGDANLFYTVVSNIDDDVNLGPSPVNPAVQMVGFINANRAILRGAETGARFRFTPTRSLYANYTFESVTDGTGNIGEVVRNTPAHALNFGAMADVARGFSASFNMGYKDAYVIANQADQINVPAYWRLDARVAYAIPRHENVKVFVTGQNLLKPQHVEFADGLAVPRTFGGGVSAKF